MEKDRTGLTGRSVWRKIRQDLQEDLKGTKKLLYSIVKNDRKDAMETASTIKNVNGSIVTEPDQILERWKDYFEQLLNVEERERMANYISEVDVNEDFPEISIEEVKDAMSQMKRGKAAWEEGIPVELLIAAGPRVLLELQHLFNEAYWTERIPADWQKGIVCPIFKKDDKTMCGIYRGITLLSHAAKLYLWVLEGRLHQCMEDVLGEWQHGFRPRRSMLDLIFTMKMILEKTWEWGLQKFILFIDFEKAFDRVERSDLWSVLANDRYKIPPKLRRVIRNTYSQCLSKVQGRDGRIDWFNIDSGVR